MTSTELNQAINNAVTARDWALIRVLGEQALADGVATETILYNLGLAYLQENDPALAVSVFLAIPKQARDQDAQKALKDALTRSGLDDSDLDLGSHGLRAVLVDFAGVISPVPFPVISAVCLPLLFVVALLTLHLSKGKKAFLTTRLGRLSLSLSCLLVLMGLGSLGVEWFSNAQRGQWCAVVSVGTNVFTQPNQDATAVRNLELASPVLAVSDVKKPWVQILHASGISGWVESLKVRCVDEPK